MLNRFISASLSLLLVSLLFSCSEDKAKLLENQLIQELEKEELVNAQEWDQEIEQMDALLMQDTLDFSFKPTPESLKYEAKQKRIKVGKLFPEYKMLDSREIMVSNIDFNKGYILYSFWATWCGSCIDHIVSLRDAQGTELFDKAKFVSVSIDRKEDVWQQFIQQYNMNEYMTNIRISREHPLSDFLYKEILSIGDDSKIAKSYGVVAPAYCLVKDGVIVTTSPVLPKNKEAFLNQLIGLPILFTNNCL